MRIRRIVLGLALAAVLVAGGFAAVTTAEQRALSAERAYVADRLDDAACLEEWGVDEGTVAKRAHVTGVTARGLRVRVTMPYAYRVEQDGEPLFADTGSEATYVVTLGGARRVQGDRVAPC